MIYGLPVCILVPRSPLSSEKGQRKTWKQQTLAYSQSPINLIWKNNWCIYEAFLGSVHEWLLRINFKSAYIHVVHVCQVCHKDKIPMQWNVILIARWMTVKICDIYHIYMYTLNIVSKYSLQLPHWGSFNEYPQSSVLREKHIYPCKLHFLFKKWSFLKCSLRGLVNMMNSMFSFLQSLLEAFLKGMLLLTAQVHWCFINPAGVSTMCHITESCSPLLEGLWFCPRLRVSKLQQISSPSTLFSQGAYI